MRLDSMRRLFSVSAFFRTVFAVSAIWITGCLFGVWAAMLLPDSSAGMIRNLPGRGNVINLFLLPLIPVLMTYIVARFSKVAVYVLIFAKGFSYCCCAGCVCLAYGSAGWLVERLFFLADILSLPALLWLWISVLYENTGRRLFRFVMVSLWIISVHIFDYYICSPFLISIL